MPSIHIHRVSKITIERHIQEESKCHVINLWITSENCSTRYNIVLFSDEIIEMEGKQ